MALGNKNFFVYKESLYHLCAGFIKMMLGELIRCAFDKYVIY